MKRNRWVSGGVTGASLIVLVGLGCGGRTGLSVPVQRDAGPEPPDAADARVVECEKPEDCPGFGDLCLEVACDLIRGICVTVSEVTCDDDDECTGDSCNPDTGECAYTQLMVDNDGDNHFGPRPGFAPGEPGSCGDDCDDTSALAFPGNTELCDGVDNDCNGVVDDNATFVPVGQDAIRISGEVAPAFPGGLDFSGSSGTGYLSAYTGTVSSKTRVFTQRISGIGTPDGEAEQITNVNADAQGGAMVWTGDRYGIVWSDRRDADYEVFFNRTDAAGAKLGPDVRVSFELGFSVNVSIAFNGLHFFVVWQDDRDGRFSSYGQRIDLEGNLIGSNVRLSEEFEGAESPTIAIGDHNVGVAWLSGGAYAHEIHFRRFTPELAPEGGSMVVTEPGQRGVFPTVEWNEDGYVVAWYDTDDSPFTIYGAVIDEDGSIAIPATRLTTGPRHARYPSILPLGDRMLLVFSDDRDDNLGYELYGKMLSASLAPLGPDVRITRAPGQSVYPVARFGPEGDVGVLFRDDRLGTQHVYFTRLACVVPTSPR